MPAYEVKAWIRVEAENERDAYERAAQILDSLPAPLVSDASLDGPEGVYELDEDES